MRRAPGPLRTSVVIAARSSPAFATAGTALTSLVLTPLLEAGLLVAVSASVGSADLRSTAYASVLLAFGLSVVVGTVEQVTRDRQLGVLHEVVGFGLASPAYWCGKLAPPLAAAIVPACAGAVAVWALDPTHDHAALGSALRLIPVAALAGGAFGVTAAVASLGLSDPYLVSNLAHSVLLVTAGVVLPHSLYPAWLAWIATYLPFTAVIEALRGCDAGPLVLRELALGAAWCVLGVAIGRRVLAGIRAGRRPSEVW